MILQHLTMHLGEEKCKVEEYLCEQLRGSQFRSNGPILGLDKWHPVEAERLSTAKTHLASFAG